MSVGTLDAAEQESFIDLFASAYGWSVDEILALPLDQANRLAALVERRRTREIKHALVRASWPTLTKSAPAGSGKLPKRWLRR